MKNHCKYMIHNGFYFYSVGVPGFEPGTPCSQSRCANRAALHPETTNPVYSLSALSKSAVREGFEPSVPFNQYGSLANC